MMKTVGVVEAKAEVDTVGREVDSVETEDTEMAGMMADYLFVLTAASRLFFSGCNF